MSWEKEWGKLLLNEEGMNEFLVFLKKNNIQIKNNKISNNLTIEDSTIHWSSEGDNSVEIDHEKRTNKLFWTWITNEYIFKENEICVINLIDEKLKKSPLKNQEVNISTLIFNSDRSEELKYLTVDLYEDNSYLFS